VNTEQAPYRILTLDGWRGIAILLVLFNHVMNACVRNISSPWLATGHHGVTLFFVISGFLISANLTAGPIDLKRFYIRRFFRLMPVAWAYLGVLLLIDASVHIVSPSAIVSSLFFYRNFTGTAFGSSTWHFWSLSLEEQFYLAWPPVLFARRYTPEPMDRCRRHLRLRTVPMGILGTLQPGPLELPDAGSRRCPPCRLPVSSVSEGLCASHADREMVRNTCIARSLCFHLLYLAIRIPAATA
jgi:peptidoglycan/LPS O-acetylase OafA/YrhL